MAILDLTNDLSALFSLQVSKTPDAPALEDIQRTYTYAELDQAVEVLAQAVVELRQAPQLEVGHGLARLLDLRRIADIAGCVLRHVGLARCGPVSVRMRCGGLGRVRNRRFRDYNLDRRS